MCYELIQHHTYLTVTYWSEDVTPPPLSGIGPGYPLPCVGVIEPPQGFL